MTCYKFRWSRVDEYSAVTYDKDPDEPALPDYEEFGRIETGRIVLEGTFPVPDERCDE